MSKHTQRPPFASVDTHPELPIDPDVVQVKGGRQPAHFQPSLIFFVFVGGYLGTYARHLIIEAFPTTENTWPVATMIVNLLGAFILGFLLEGLARLGKDEGMLRIVRLLMGTGFIGAFTTYSTFAVEINVFIASHKASEAIWYLLTTVICGVILSGLGIHIAANHHTKRAAR